MKVISRRRFVKKSLIMGAAFTAFPSIFLNRSLAGNIPKTVVHPDIDNLRVVGITDAAMTRGIETGATWQRQNELELCGYKHS